MSADSLPEVVQSLTSVQGLQIAGSVISVLVYFLITRFAFPIIEKGVAQSRFKSDATVKAFRVVRILSGMVTFAALLIIWGFDFSGLLVVITSVITVVGIALFASWSILSNITAFIFLLMQPSFRRGNYIRVIDADNYMEGYITEVTLLNTRLITEDRELIVYPNNLLISRASIINPKRKVASMGKFTDFQNPEEAKEKSGSIN